MDFNKIKEMGLEYAEKGKKCSNGSAERGKTQAKIVNEQTKLARAQRSWVRWYTAWPRATKRTQPLWISTSR